MPMRAYEIIQRKQSGWANSAEEIRFMVAGALDGRVQEAQVSAWFMAIHFQGMDGEETWELTRAMRRSGREFDLDGLPGYKLDKHSTGGVGDKVSFILAPMLAAAGLVVPSITGRGLGHTGGTLDKLESLPGLRTDLDEEEFLGVLKDCGLSLIGQTAELVPADRMFYALRDVTATVDSVPLICASILSKKFAEGIDGLVLDVKCGSGAIFPDLRRARELAGALVGIARRGDREVAALITDMDAPLGRQVGNWNELVESLECLRGHGSPDLMEVSLALGCAALLLSGRSRDPAEALAGLKAVIADGSAAEALLKMVEAQGGAREWLLKPHRAPRPAHGRTVIPGGKGFVQAIDAREVGLVAVALGAGRARVDEDVDHTAGFTIHRQVGEFLEADAPVCDIYSSRVEELDPLAERIREAWRIGPERPDPPGEILVRDGDGAQWVSRVVETVGAPFSAADWRELLAAEGLGLSPHPLAGDGTGRSSR